ncbi:recombinase family protein [Chengkuizengella sediminis]|nr:recombinase family protein [Chengkuizengella sediminis]
MVYGYSRVSSRDQNLETQIDQLKARRCDLIIQEKMTGATFKRPELEKLLKQTQSDDTIVVTRVDRLGRNTQQLLQLVEDLQTRNIHLYIIELGIEATHRNGKLFLTILSALAENERALLTEKRNAGLENAKRKGIKLGRKAKSKAKVDLAIQLWKKGEKTIKEIEESTGVGKSILYREVKKYGLKRE